MPELSERIILPCTLDLLCLFLLHFILHSLSLLCVLSKAQYLIYFIPRSGIKCSFLSLYLKADICWKIPLLRPFDQSITSRLICVFFVFSFFFLIFFLHYCNISLDQKIISIQLLFILKSGIGSFRCPINKECDFQLQQRMAPRQF